VPTPAFSATADVETARPGLHQLARHDRAEGGHRADSHSNWVLPVVHNANLLPVISGSEIELSGRNAKVRREGYRPQRK